MPLINITAEAEQAIREAAKFEFTQTAVQKPDGTFDIPFQWDTLARLHSLKLEGETISDTILRVIRASKGQKPS